MNIGSRVRLLHGKEEGVITKIRSGKYLEIDLGDGFSIPVLASEVVLISPMEARLETPAPKQPGPGRGDIPAARQAFAVKGIYLAFVPVNDREVVLHLVNLTGWRILFTMFGRNGNQAGGLASGLMEAGTSHQVTGLLLKDFGQWPVFDTSLLYYSDEKTPEQFILRHSLRCRIQSFHKHLQKAPLLNVNAHVFQIDSEAGAPEKEARDIPADTIRNKMLEGNAGAAGPSRDFNRSAAEIDLHTDALQVDITGMSGGQILDRQLSAFKNYLEQAIADGLDQVLIIHGAGQGTLRQEIHRQLSKHPNVAYYKDARKEKFGYGATVAHLK